MPLALLLPSVLYYSTYHVNKRSTVVYQLLVNLPFLLASGGLWIARVDASGLWIARAEHAAGADDSVYCNRISGTNSSSCKCYYCSTTFLLLAQHFPT
jgi:hypothetical protein